MQEILYPDDFKKFSETFDKLIESGHINFLIGSGASCPAIELAEEIEKELNDQLLQKKDFEANNSAFLFIKKLELQNSALFNSNENQNKEISDTLENYVDFLNALDRILFERKNTILPKQANIFTTNYDEFFEKAACNLPSTILNDGFNRNVGRYPYEFSPEIFSDRVYRSGKVYDTQSEVPTINIVKLHGSLSWIRDKKGGIFYRSCGYKEFENHEKNVYVNLLNMKRIYNKDKNYIENFILNALSKRAIILPNMKKYESTLLDRVYFDLLRLYSNALEKENALLFVFGFSFADEHIFDITSRALRNPTAQMVIFSFNDEATENFRKKFNEYRNVTIIHPKVKEEINFFKMNKILANVPPKECKSDD